MAVDYGDGGCVCDADVIGGDAEDFAVGLMCGVDGEVAFPTAALVHEPEV